MKDRVAQSPEQYLNKADNSTKRLNRISVKQGKCIPQTDDLIVEEPLAIWLRQSQSDTSIKEKHLFSTMRTPGSDVELVFGMLLSEGVIDSVAHVNTLIFGDGEDSNECYAELVPDVEVDWLSKSRSTSFSSCGLCGKSAIRLLELRGVPKPDNTARWLPEHVVVALPDTLKAQQKLFVQTGASHGCGLFDANGSLLSIAEDVGRHNALDKLLGLRASVPEFIEKGKVIGLSGRVSIEMMQKVVMSGVPVVVSVGAPTQLAVQMAQRFGVTLIGFCQQEGFNIYSGEQRLTFGSKP
ncbi:formate dehydrogenase accessory sulfurtransferase FdhD [Vibrio sp. S9_S30]|nr:formate dehydrogenase accessory sulfurtransferase FdhD [Vibrio sp. S9_S30]